MKLRDILPIPLIGSIFVVGELFEGYDSKLLLAGIILFYLIAIPAVFGPILRAKD